MKKVGMGLVWVIGVFLIVGAIAEPFLIDVSDPATDRSDWGGPSLAGVLAVHILPGILAATVIPMTLSRRRRRRATAS